jgi:hypothetical protein
MIRGITVYRNRVVEVCFRAARFIPIAGLLLYLFLVSAFVLPVAILYCLLIMPAAWTTQFVKHKRYIPMLIRTAGSLEHISLQLSHARKSVVGCFHAIRRSMRWQWPLS